MRRNSMLKRLFIAIFAVMVLAGNVYALSADGSLLWQYTTFANVRSSPAIGPDGTLYIGSLDNKLYAFGP